MTDGAWDLGPGEKIRRVELHDRFKGRRLGGISSSKQTSNLMIFTGESGHEHGYVDGWHADGCFHYTGEGQIGDQTLTNGNRSLAEHRSQGLRIRLFEGTGGVVTYVGEFELDQENPWYSTDAVDRQQQLRKVIVFRLRPVGQIARDAQPSASESWLPPTQAAQCKEVAPETRVVDGFTVAATDARSAQRREALLVDAFLTWRRNNALPELTRLRIKPPGEVQPLFSDLFDREHPLLIEAKGTVTREAMRMAVGQLYDYRRFAAENCGLAVLVPEMPRRDLLEYLKSCDVGVVIPSEADQFVHLEPQWLIS